MLQILERIQRLLHDGVARLTPQLRDERDATPIVLVGGVVEASGPWRSDTSIHGGGWCRNTDKRRLDGEAYQRVLATR
jgi:hypothetical protein